MIFYNNFTDLPYWSTALYRLGQTGLINAQHGFDIVNEYSVAFFDKELKGQPSSLLNGPSLQYLEVNFENDELFARMEALLDDPAEEYPGVDFETRKP